MPTEPVPVEQVKDKLSATWVYGNVASTSANPVFVEVNGEGERIRFNTQISDTLLVRPGTPAMTENFIGNYKYGNRYYNVEVEIWTNNQRQRLYDLMREIRRVVHSTKHGLTHYQRWQVTSFVEPTIAQANIWTGTMTILLENNAILLET